MCPMVNAAAVGQTAARRRSPQRLHRRAAGVSRPDTCLQPFILSLLRLNSRPLKRNCSTFGAGIAQDFKPGWKIFKFDS